MDTVLFFLINHGMANPLFDVLMPALTHQGYLLVLPLVLYALAAGRLTSAPSGRTYFLAASAAVVIAVLAVILADAACAWLKVLISRPRPCTDLEGVRLVIACPRSFSFPSSHATTSFAFAVPFFLLTRPWLTLPWRAAPLFLAAAIAFSRPYLGVHYPTDVLAGTLLGAGVSGMLCGGYGWMMKRFS